MHARLHTYTHTHTQSLHAYLNTHALACICIVIFAFQLMSTDLYLHTHVQRHSRLHEYTHLKVHTRTYLHCLVVVCIGVDDGQRVGEARVTQSHHVPDQLSHRDYHLQQTVSMATKCMHGYILVTIYQKYYWLGFVYTYRQSHRFYTF